MSLRFETQSQYVLQDRLANVVSFVLDDLVVLQFFFCREVGGHLSCGFPKQMP